MDCRVKPGNDHAWVGILWVGILCRWYQCATPAPHALSGCLAPRPMRRAVALLRRHGTDEMRI
jgi:hypothetical protein